MEALPQQLLQPPRPLVDFLGSVENEPDVHDRIIAGLVGSDAEQRPSLNFRIVALNHAYPPKRSVAAPLKPPESPVRSFSDNFRRDGILKANWLKKHSDVVPSVVVLVTTFCIDWPAGEMIRRQTLISDQLTQLRNMLNGRETKIFVCLVRTGSGNLDKDMLDDRLTNLKRYCNLDARHLFYLTPGDFEPLSPTMRRCARSIREASLQYYTSQGRRMKKLERGGTRTGESLLRARYNFKEAFFLELRGDESAMRYYIAAYIALEEMTSSVDAQMINQVKAVAEYVSFKICNLHLRSSRVREALDFFRRHVNTFRNVYTETQWEHYGWIAKQYVILAQLLIKLSVKSPNQDSDPWLYFHNAALWELRRRDSFLRSSAALVADDTAAAKRYAGLEVRPSEYVGGPPQLVDPVLAQPVEHTAEVTAYLRQQMLRKEQDVDHSAIAHAWLEKSIELVNPRYKRRLALLRSLLGDEAMAAGAYREAYQYLLPLSEELLQDSWLNSAISVLEKLVQCSFFLGNGPRYFELCQRLASMVDVLSFSERLQYHQNIVGMLAAQAGLPQIARSASADGENDLELPMDRAGFGSAAGEEGVQTAFPEAFQIEAGGSSPLFKVRVEFDRRIAHVGELVDVTIGVTSLFPGRIHCSSMIVHFTNDIIVQNIHDSTSLEIRLKNSMTRSAGSPSRPRRQSFENRSSLVEEDDLNASTIQQPDVSGASLLFTPQAEVLFQFTIRVPEKGVQYSGSLAVERLDLRFGLDDDASASSNHYVSFSVPLASKEYLKYSRVKQRAGAASELLFLLPPTELRSLLRIARPAPTVRLLEPQEQTILEGSLTKVELVFNAGADQIMEGKLYLSCNPAPVSLEETERYFFWYPDVEMLRNSTNKFETREMLEAEVPYLPMTLSSSMQPAAAYVIPDQPAHGTFKLPVFVRCFHAGRHQAHFRIEYIPSENVTSPVHKEFDVSFTCVKPLNISYSVSPYQEAQSGLQRDAYGNTVALGDSVFVLGTIQNLQKAPILIEGVRFAQANANAANFRIESNEDLLHDSTQPHSSLQSSNTTTTCVLQQNEALTVSFHGNCIGAVDDQMIGHLVTQWREDGNGLLSPPPTSASDVHSFDWLPDLATSHAKPDDTPQSQDSSSGRPVSMALEGARSTSLKALQLDDEANGSASSAVAAKSAGSFFDPDNHALLSPDIASDQPLAIKRTTEAMFPGPVLKIVEPPFDVRVQYPPSAVRGRCAYINCTIVNRRDMPEKVRVAVDPGEQFVVSGRTQYVTEILPAHDLTLEFVLVPLVCGEINLPFLRVTWEREKVAILENRARSIVVT